jgi:hypothetical protein
MTGHSPFYGLTPAGKYLVRIFHNGGNDTLTVRRFALLTTDTVLSEAAPGASLAPGGKVEGRLELKAWPMPTNTLFRLELEAQPGKTNVSGRFEVEPVL